ncbi:hypothetical protein JJE00_07635 [Candidatus Bathyarchaeota archaeon]|nr:hypothetical protein [Candidatus Bathyarchaeota archaeon]
MKRGARFFYLMGTLVLILTVWTGLEVQWSRLDEAIAASMFLNLIIGMSVGLTEIAVGWLIGLHLEEPQKQGE